MLVMVLKDLLALAKGPGEILGSYRHSCTLSHCHVCVITNIKVN